MGLTERMARDLETSRAFRDAVCDVLDTALALVAEKYDVDVPFTPGRQYSRKDPTRLLAWGKNVDSIVYGHKVHRDTRTCPIFVTMHKSEGVSASTACSHGLVDIPSMRWFSKNRRTLASDEVRAIVNNEVAIHVFAQKDDADKNNFYDLGRATAEDAIQDTMPDKEGKPLNVVRMTLRFEAPIDSAVYDYFHPVVTL